MRKDNQILFGLLLSGKRWLNLTLIYYLRFREISKIVIQFALAIEVEILFGDFYRQKDWNVKRGLKGNAHQKTYKIRILVYSLPKMCESCNSGSKLCNNN